MNWEPISDFTEERLKLCDEECRWVSFTDGQAVGTRIIALPMIFGFGFAFTPTHFMVIDLPGDIKALEPPTVENEPQRKRFPQDTHYDSQGYCDNPARGF